MVKRIFQFQLPWKANRWLCKSIPLVDLLSDFRQVVFSKERNRLVLSSSPTSMFWLSVRPGDVNGSALALFLLLTGTESLPWITEPYCVCAPVCLCVRMCVFVSGSALACLNEREKQKVSECC